MNHDPTEYFKESSINQLKGFVAVKDAADVNDLKKLNK